VFPAQRGGCHLNDKRVSQVNCDALKAIGRDDLRIHDLGIFRGANRPCRDLAESMARLGHSTVKASLIYQSVVSGRDAEIAAALSDWLPAADKVAETKMLHQFRCSTTDWDFKMRRILCIALAFAALLLAPLAHADSHDDQYLSAIAALGITAPPDQLIAAGHSICDAMAGGGGPFNGST